MSDGSTGHVLLLHGIWMVGSTLRPLAAHLRRAGWSVETFGYPSVTGGPERAVPALRERLVERGRQHAVVHVVGHSLGGLVAVAAACTELALPPGRIVCIGSPLAGSAVARRLDRLPLGTLATGRSHALLCEGLAAARPAREVGVVAGTRAFGLGRWLVRFDGPADGTVALAETRVPWLTDHCVHRATHTGLLVSREVAEAVDRFLRHGRFGDDQRS
jgi:pimeloyl-ACP methyl ester carboxylesterase